MSPFAAIVLAGPATVTTIAVTAVRPWRPGRVEAATAAALGGATAALLLDDRLAVTALPLIVLGPAAAAVDLHEGRLPDVLTGPLLATTLLLAALSGPAGWHGIAVAAAATVGLVALKVAATDVIGWGDVKLAPTVTIVLGQHGAALTGLAYIVGLLAVTAAATACTDRAATVPYGPALLLGTLLTITAQ